MRARARFGITWRRGEVNGQPGALFFDRDGRLISVMSLDVAEGQIQGVSSVVNPDKLRHLGPLGDVNALLRERT
jgi:RNA polymerase sigma-70 factor (ECF subfamily)